MGHVGSTSSPVFAAGTSLKIHADIRKERKPPFGNSCNSASTSCRATRDGDGRTVMGEYMNSLNRSFKQELMYSLLNEGSLFADTLTGKNGTCVMREEMVSVARPCGEHRASADSCQRGAGLRGGSRGGRQSRAATSDDSPGWREAPRAQRRQSALALAQLATNPFRQPASARGLPTGTNFCQTDGHRGRSCK